MARAMRDAAASLPSLRRPRRSLDVVWAVVAASAILVVIAGLGILWPENNQMQEEVEELATGLVGVEAFEVACRAVRYREICLETLLPNYRAHTVTAEELAGILVASASQFVAGTLQAVLANRGARRLGFAGERVCHSTLVSSVQQLDASVAALKSTPENSCEEIQTRVRAATEFQTTCIDALVATRALEPRTVHAKERAEKRLHNAMTVVAALARFGPDLLSWQPTVDYADRGDSEEDFPAWVSEEALTGVDPHVDVLVAKDGSGRFKSIQGAVDAAPRNNARRYVIAIKAGVYNEQVLVPKTAINLMFLGDGAGASIISGNRSVAFTPHITTFFSPSLIVEGPGFIGKGFTARNTAAVGGIGQPQLKRVQAVAMRVSADMAAFYQCAFEGGQDALHAHTFRQFYRECNVTGTSEGRFVLTSDGAVARFHSCSMLAKL